MGVRITLDSTLLTDTPIGWDDAVISSERDPEIRGLFIVYTTDLIFWGQGFDYIDNIMNQDYCQTIAVKIESDDCEAGVFVEEFLGTIQLTQITTYDVDKRTIATKILDETYDAKISNNKSLKAFVDVGESKNGVSIEAVTPVNISLFLPTAGTAFNAYLGTTREGFRVFDCFRFIIDYMTDGEVGFKSDLFAGVYHDWMLFNGKEVRIGNGGGEQFEVSFKELFLEMHKKTNLSFSIEPSPAGYSNSFQLRLEETAFFEQDDAILTLDNVMGILMDFNKEELYSDVLIGSKSFDDDVVLSYPPLNFKAFKEENWTISGQCNIDKTLNLVSDYIIDTNVIEDVLINTPEKYDKKTFFIVTDGTQAIKFKEYDEPVSEGVDDAGTINRLTDSTADFNADGVVAGDMAVNMLTGLAANINSVDAGGTFCILDTDIFNNGDGYQIRDTPFSYNNPLTNIEVIERFIGGLPNSVIKRLSTSSTADFYAGITSEVEKTVFDATINPIEYDDDSTPPFFDTGGNYDTATFQYTIPNSGLYGFRGSAVLRMNGVLGNDLVSNGDFSAGFTDWVLSSGKGTITSGEYRLNTSQPNSAFLRQYLTITPGSTYVLNFDTVITKGFIRSPTGDITTSGNHSVTLDFSGQQITNTPVSIDFAFGSTPGELAGAIITIDNVTLKQTTRFDVVQTFVRSSAAGVPLQTFSETYTFPFGANIFQREEVLIAESTFSTFAGEKISVKLEINKIGGNGNTTTLVPQLFNQVTQEIDFTSFETILIDDGGGDLLPVDPATFPIYKYKFEKGITLAQFKALKDAPEKAIQFSKGTINHLFAWRNSIEHARKTGLTTFNVRSKTKINGDC